MKKNTRKTRTLALTLALCLALVCLAPAALVCASTDLEPPEPLVYENIYYFSDYDCASNFYNQVLLNIQGVNSVHFEQIEFEGLNTLQNMYSLGVFNNVEDSLVIMELRSLRRENYALLEDIFDVLKSNGCKIMFINGVEEVKMLDMWQSDFYSTDDNSFLESADIHVNLDIFSVFIDTIFEMYEDDAGMDSVTILLDGSFLWNELSYYGFPGYIEGWEYRANANDYYAGDIFDYHILRYFRYYMQEAGGYNSLLDFMNYMQIKIFCYAGNDTYMNLLTGEIYCTDGWDSYEFYETAANEFVFAIGTSFRGEDYLDEWLNSLVEYMEMTEWDFPVYFYNGSDLTTDNAPSEFYEIHGTNYFEFNILPDIIRALACDADMSVYDNWAGRCFVTHKPIYAGEGGWLNMYMRFLPILPI